MKQEAFRLERIIYEENNIVLLDDFSLRIYKGEIFGLVSIDFCGRAQLYSILSRNIPLNYGFVYVGERLVNSYKSSDMSFNRVSFISPDSGLCAGVSVSENIFALRQGFKKKIINRRTLDKQTKALCAETGINIDVTKPVAALSHYERMCAELLKAYVNSSRLTVISDVSNELNANEYDRFIGHIKSLAQNGMSFLYVGSHHEDVFSVCGRASFMENGRIVRTLDNPSVNDDSVRYIVSPFPVGEMIENDGLRENEIFSGDKILEFCGVTYKTVENLSFSVKNGETLVLLGIDAEFARGISDLAEKKAKPENGSVNVTSGGVAVVSPDPGKTMIFSGMSVTDNLCFLLDKKYKKIWSSNRLKRSVMLECSGYFGSSINDSDTSNLNQEQLIELVYLRIMLYKPKLCILIQPFAQADMYLRRHIIKLINQLKKRGTAVLILAVSKSDSLLVADRVLQCENGKIKKCYKKEDFYGLSEFDYGILKSDIQKKDG